MRNESELKPTMKGTLIALNCSTTDFSVEFLDNESMFTGDLYIVPAFPYYAKDDVRCGDQCLS